MDKILIFKGLIFLLFITAETEAIFFHYPKKALFDFIQSLKEKKESLIKKPSHEDVHHYHLHYYPVPVSIDFKPKSNKPGFDHFHREQLNSLGWNDHEYKHVPEPEFIAPPSSHEIETHDSDGLTIQDQLDIGAMKHKIEHHSNHEKIEPRHISPFFLPFHQEIILHQPAVAHKEEKKYVHPFAAFFQKLQHIKNTLFSFHDDKMSSSSFEQFEDRIEKPVAIVTTKLNNPANPYGVHFHAKNLRKS